MRTRLGLAVAAVVLSMAGSACAADASNGKKAETAGSPAVSQAATTLAAAETGATVEPVAAPLARPVPGNRLVHGPETANACIGGVLCDTFCEDDAHDCRPERTLTIKLDKPARIDTIQLSAHDNIGETRRSRLVIKVNGKEVASKLVYRLGSTLSFDINATGEVITIESAHQYNGFLLGGEEAVVWDVYIFGEDRS